ncbi:MAG: M48 family metallopeptidase [Myxococcota bacterium]
MAQEVRGILYDGSTSRGREALLRFYADGSVRLVVDGSERTLAYHELGIPARLGSTPRRIRLPDGAELETPDNEAVDAVQSAHGPARRRWLPRDWVHRLESRLPMVLVATVLVLAAGVLFAVRGVPALAREAAFALSPELTASLGQGTLDVLDRTFVPSALSAERQAALRRAFEDIVAQADEGYDYRLEFRGGGLIGANAFALPSGSVVLTDELVGLAEHDEEIVAVLAHEVGHVVHRHGLRQAIQSSLLAVGIVVVTGDLSSTSTFVAALPTLLAESSYSRDFEREADDYAVAYLKTRHIAPRRLGDLLQRMDEAQGGSFDVSFLSTHPSTEERIARLGDASPENDAP